MTTKQIIKQMEKEFDEAVYAEAKKRCFKSQTAVIFWDGFGGYDVEEKWKKEVMSDSNFVKSFISSYTRTLLESFGEEMIKEGERVVDGGAYGDEYCENENCHFGLGYKVARDCTDMQRLKVKEIISSITN